MISQDLRFEVLQLYREGHPGYTPNKFSLVKGLDLVLANLENPEVFNYVGVNRLGSSKKSFDYALKPETKQDQITVEQYAAFLRDLKENKNRYEGRKGFIKYSIRNLGDIFNLPENEKATMLFSVTTQIRAGQEAELEIHLGENKGYTSKIILPMAKEFRSFFDYDRVHWD
jgi:hypothetical protein